MTLYQYSGSQGFQSLPVTTFTFSQNFSLTGISFDNNSITFDGSSQNLVSFTKRAFSYNLNSTVVDNPLDYDYQLITSSFELSDDFGFVNQSSGKTIDYLLIADTATVSATPFGSITLGGSAITSANYRLFFSGSALEKVIYSPDDTSGTLFSFGEKVESRSFDYNDSSIENTEEDFGLISQITGQSEDYQSIILSSGVTEEYGLITESTGGTVVPFGSITLGGSAITSANYRLFFSGSALEKVIYSPDDTSGTLFSFGEKVEKVTYDYNQESITENIDDYGFISEFVSGGNDYGNISNNGGSQPEENYGLILDSVNVTTLIPFGSISLTGGSIESFEANPPENTQLFTISGSLVEKETDSYNSVGNVSISGISSNKFASNYVGSGTLFSFGEKAEKVTYNYNQSSTIEFEDYELIANGHSSNEEFGFINSVIDDGIENYGRIGEVDSTPFGTITLSGTSSISFQKGTFFTSGSIFVLSGSAYAESFTADTPDNTQLFQISGISSNKFVSNYVGSGTLFSFGEKVEKVTYSYNESSQVLYDIVDYQSIASSPTEANDDFGLITNINDASIDYGFLVGLGATESLYPFGSIYISGAVSDIKETDSYVGSGTITISGELLPPNIDYTPSPDGSGSITLSGTLIESETDSYVGLGAITISGNVNESLSFQTPESTQLFNISGIALESETDVYIGLGSIAISGNVSDIKETDSYSGSGSITLSGTLIESETDSYVGLGAITISDFGRESEIDVYNASGSLSLSGTALESFSAQTPENTQLFTISGSLIEKETDSYSGSGTISLSGTALESETDSYVGLGTITLSGDAVEGKVGFYRGVGDITISGSKDESRTIFIPTSGIGTGFIGGSISIFTLDVTRYYSPIYPRNALIGDPGSGIGTIRLNDDAGLTITRATLPYKARGTITLSNGLKESFSKANYNGSGVVSISGIASTKEIQVYAYYGDLKDPGTSGTITLSEQSAPIIERNTESYVGLGTIFLSDSLERRRLRAWDGSGVITLSGIGLDSITVPVSDTVLFNFSGSGFESFIPTTEIGSGIITISGSSDTPLRTFAHEGSGSITLSGTAQIRPVIKQIGRGTIRIVPRFRVDDDYISCDNDIPVQLINEPLLNNTSTTFDNSNVTFDSQLVNSSPVASITCDREDDGTVKFVANPSEDTILFTIGGSSVTSVASLDRYVGIGNIFISGGYTNLRSTRVDVGTGIITISQSSKDVEIDSYVGLGTIFSLSGSSESRVANPPENTILVQIGGTASTRVEFEYSYVGVGTQYFSGIGSERIVYADRGTGLITLSGNLVYPDIKFVPSPDGSGTISIIGTSKEKLTVVPSVQGGSLFTLYGGFESFSRTNYIGIGTIFIVGAASSIVNNPFQPSRVYVTII